MYYVHCQKKECHAKDSFSLLHNEARFITAMSSSQYRERNIYHIIQNATKRPLHYRAPLYNAMGFGNLESPTFVKFDGNTTLTKLCSSTWKNKYMHKNILLQHHRMAKGSRNSRFTIVMKTESSKITENWYSSPLQVTLVVGSREYENSFKTKTTATFCFVFLQMIMMMMWELHYTSLIYLVSWKKYGIVELVVGIIIE